MNRLSIRLITVTACVSTLVLALGAYGRSSGAQEQPANGEQPTGESKSQPAPTPSKQLPHGEVAGQVIPMQADLAKYVGRWQVGSAKEHTGREAVISWQWAAGKGGVMIDLHFPSSDGKSTVSTTHGLLAYHPGTGRIEVTSVGGNGDYLRGSVFCDGNRHEWNWDSWTIAEGGKARSFKQVLTFAEDGKSYQCVAHVRKGLEWAKAFESTFTKLPE